MEYLGLRINSAGKWVAVMDCGKGPENRDAASIEQAIGNRVRSEGLVPQALLDAESDLESLRSGKDVRYYEEEQ